MESQEAAARPTRMRQRHRLSTRQAPPVAAAGRAAQPPADAALLGAAQEAREDGAGEESARAVRGDGGRHGFLELYF